MEVVCELWIYQTDARTRKYKDIETLDVNASLDQIEKAATAQPLRSDSSFCSDARSTVRPEPMATVAR